MSQYPTHQRLQADVLLVTVTEVETMAVRSLFSEERRHYIGDKTYYDFGEVSGTKVFLVQSEMGSGGLGGATLTVQRAIDLLAPSAVIMVGIAFGVDPVKQQIGDILVSQQILDYEVQRIGSGRNQRLAIIPRGDKAAASPKLLNRLRDGAMDWKRANEVAKIRFGLVLSGAKLVDNLDYREKLQAFAPEAIGGEMEGAGVYAAAQSNKVDWILVKAICDWADGNKSHNKDDNQELAALNAARFIVSVIKLGGLRVERQNTDQISSQVASQNVQASVPTGGQGQPRAQSTKSVKDTGPINVFISYAQEDERFKKQLETHLTQLRRDKIIQPWTSELTKPGEKREEQIAEHIKSAQIILLLMSPSFIASDQLYENEMTEAIKRQKAGDPVRVIPIYIRPIEPTDPDSTPDYQKIQGLPRNGRPIESWRSADEAWAQIAGEIRAVCKDLLSNAKIT